MKAVFLGNPPLGLAVLERLGRVADVALVVTQLEPPRNSRKQGLPVARYAEQQGWNVIPPPTDPQELTRAIAAVDPEVCVVAAYGHLIPVEALALANGRWLNVHSSLLPRYRGATPVQQAILDGLDMTGVTIMEVSEKLDAGPIVGQAEVPIEPVDTTASLTRRIAERGADLLTEILPRYAAGVIEPEPQDDGTATMTGTLSKQDGRIDWGREAAYLERFVRAMQPWPGAWTEAGGQRVEILETAPADPMEGAPGTFDGPPLRVATADGALRIERLKPAGKGGMPGDAWLRGYRGEKKFA